MSFYSRSYTRILMADDTVGAPILNIPAFVRRPGPARPPPPRVPPIARSAIPTPGWRCRPVSMMALLLLLLLLPCQLQSSLLPVSRLQQALSGQGFKLSVVDGGAAVLTARATGERKCASCRLIASCLTRPQGYKIARCLGC